MKDSLVAQKGNSSSVSLMDCVSNYSTGVTHSQTVLTHLMNGIAQSARTWISSTVRVIGALTPSSFVIKVPTLLQLCN